MPAASTEFNILSLKASDLKPRFEQSKNNFEDNESFEKVLENSIKSQSDNYNTDNKIGNKISGKMNDYASELPEKPETINNKFVSKKVSNEKNDEIVFENLNLQEKELIEKLAIELGINQESIIKLLNTLNIDINMLKQFENVEIAAAKVSETLNSYLNQKDIVNEVNFNNSELKDISNKITNNDSKTTQNVAEKNTEFSKTQNVADKNTDFSKTQNIEKDTQNVQKIQDSDVENITKTTENVTKTSSEKSQQNLSYVNKQDDVSTDSNNVNFSENSKDGLSNSSKKSASGQDSQDSDKDSQSESSFLKDAKIVNQKTNVNTENTFVEQNVIKNPDISSTFDKTSFIKNEFGQNVVQKENIFNQIVENAKVVLKDNQTEMQMDLKPENLGKLSLKIASENGLIIAKITAQSEQVKAIIESNLSQLKDSLQHQGLNIQNLSVSVGNDSNQQDSRFNNKLFVKKRIFNGLNAISVTENYVDKLNVNNPYRISTSSVDFVA